MCAELTVEEMLADPIVALVMRSDGVDADLVRRVAAEAKRRLQARGDEGPCLLAAE